jgi:hypothetical protein
MTPVGDKKRSVNSKEIGEIGLAPLSIFAVRHGMKLKGKLRNSVCLFLEQKERNALSMLLILDLITYRLRSHLYLTYRYRRRKFHSLKFLVHSLIQCQPRRNHNRYQINKFFVISFVFARNRN